jgi:hypothetical protein
MPPVFFSCAWLRLAYPNSLFYPEKYIKKAKNPRKITKTQRGSVRLSISWVMASGQQI